MKCHEVDYEIFGDDMQIVEIELDPAETVIAEAGAMNYMEDGITYETKMGDGSKPIKGVLDSLMQVGKRVLTGESIFMTHFSNNGNGKSRLTNQRRFAKPCQSLLMARSYRSEIAIRCPYSLSFTQKPETGAYK